MENTITETPEIVINGSLAQELIKGATIIFAKFSGKDWFILTQSIKGEQWRFKQFETSSRINSMNFSLMVEMNHSKRDCLKRVEKDYFDSKFEEARKSY